MSRILYCMSYSFPYGAAYAARVRALSKLIQSCGYDIDILCDYSDESQGITEYGRLFYAVQKPLSGLNRLIRLPYLYGRKLNELIVSTDYYAIISSSMYDRFDMINAISKKHSIPLILESCEWYDVRGFKRGRLDLRYWQFQHCMKFSYNHASYVIAISRALEEHYLKQGKKVIRIPGIHEVKLYDYRLSLRDDEYIRLIFAGSIFGGKEDFSNLIIAIANVNRICNKYTLHIYGPSKEEIVSGLNSHGKKSLNEIRELVYFYGRVPQTEMLKVPSCNDYGVFFRPNRRSSNAGFPTKLGEYLASGTPVITNDTGDISLVLKDGYNGYLLTDASVKQIEDCLLKIVKLEPTRRSEMRAAARESAETMLDYHAYIDVMSAFLDSISH